MVEIWLARLQVYPKQVDPGKDPAKIDVDIMVKERPMRTAEVECEWAIAPDDAGRPSVVSLVPGAPLALQKELRVTCCASSDSVRGRAFCAPVGALVHNARIAASGCVLRGCSVAMSLQVVR